MAVNQLESIEAVWLDDMIKYLGSFISKLESFGIKTTATEDSPKGYGADLVAAYDNVITDSKFSGDDWHEGSDFAKELLNQQGKRIIVFSGFLDSGAKNKKIQVNQETGSAILYIPKVRDLENPIDEFVEEASSCMFEFFKSDFDDLATIEIPDFEADFSIVKPLGYREFLSLSLKDKRAVYEEFVEGLEKNQMTTSRKGQFGYFSQGTHQNHSKLLIKKKRFSIRTKLIRYVMISIALLSFSGTT